MFGWIKVIWRIRALKASLHAYQNEQLDRLHLLLGVVDALGRVAEVLKCEKLVQWTKKELNGYASEEVQCPAWMEEYAARHPNVDFSRCPLDFWLGANHFLFKSFYRAYEERDGEVLKNPAIAEALCIIMNEPRALARKFFYRYTESPQLYGGDYDGDLKRITDDWRYYCGYPDPFTGYADWFNLVFQDTGQAVALWILQPKKLDSTPIFGALKSEISKGDFWEGMPEFPDPFGVERSREDAKPEELKVFGAGFATCTHPALRQLLQVAWLESGTHFQGGGNHRPGEWAMKWIRKYSAEQQTFVFKDVEYDFSTAPERWKVAQKVIESKEDGGVVFLGNGWRGRWNDKTSLAYKFSRYIHPVKCEGKGPGFFHLMDEPIAGNRSRKAGKRTAAGAKRMKRPSR